MFVFPINVQESHIEELANDVTLILVLFNKVSLFSLFQLIGNTLISVFSFSGIYLLLCCWVGHSQFCVSCNLCAMCVFVSVYI